MPETIHEISHEGIEKMKDELFDIGRIQKISVLIREGEKPVLIIIHKKSDGTYPVIFKNKTLTIK